MINHIQQIFSDVEKNLVDNDGYIDFGSIVYGSPVFHMPFHELAFHVRELPDRYFDELLQAVCCGDNFSLLSHFYGRDESSVMAQMRAIVYINMELEKKIKEYEI